MGSGFLQGELLQADQIVVAVPLSVLQRRKIALAPRLIPPEYDAIDNIAFGTGFKVFLKFAERFYPDLIMEGSRWRAIVDDGWDQKIYYDAAFEKPTKDNLLGLFTVSETNLPRAFMNDQELIDSVLSELTDMFGAVVRDSFQAAAVQNWAREPTIMGSYSMNIRDDLDPQDVLTPVNGRLFFCRRGVG